MYRGTEWVSITDNVISNLVAYDGLGLPPSHDITERGPSQHGETYIDFRLDPRYITLILGITGVSYSGALAKARLLTALLKHRNALIPLKIITDVGDERRISVIYKEGLTLPLSVEGSYHYRMGIELKAVDPVFYHPTLGAVTFNLGGASDDFVVPTPVPSPMGTSVLDTTRNITYDGTWRTWPKIRIIGPITDCLIENLTTDEQLDFAGVTIAANDYYDIDCTYPNKTVLDSSAVNKAADLTDTSDLVTFHLDANPDAMSGVNSIRVKGYSVTSVTEVVFTYQKLYTEI